MRVAIGLYDYGGGPVEYIRQLITHYSNRIKPTILHNYATDRRISGVPSIPGKQYSKATLPRFAIDVIRKLRGFDVVHNNGCGWFNNLTDRAAKKHGITSVITSHGLYKPENVSKEDWKWAKKERKRLLKSYDKANAIIAVSNYTKHMLQDEYGVETDIEVIYNGIETSDFKTQPPTNREEGRRIVFPGLLQVYKDPTTFINACGKMTPKPTVTFTRTGYLHDKVERIARENNVSATFVNQPPRSEYLNLLSNSNIFVASSRVEHFSIALLEAMASGCVCVASDVGGNPEAIKHKETGLLFRFGDESDLTEKLEMAATMPELGIAARKDVLERFDWSDLVPQIEEVYEKVA